MFATAYAVTLDAAVGHIPHGKESIDFIVWLFYSAAIITCVFCCLASSRYFADDDYIRGKMALMAAVVAGSAPELAKLFLY